MSEPSHQTVSAARISLLVGILVLGFKFLGFFLTHSQAIFSDALESVVNVITAIIALRVMKAVAEPADEDHPYGHGKLEYFSAAFEGGMIAFAALAIGYEAILALIQGNEVHAIETGLLYIGVGTAANFFLALYLRGVGKKHNSEALQASSAHIFSDVWTTLGVGAGLALVALTGWKWLDPAVALVMAVNLAWQGYGIVRQSIGGLIDEVDSGSLTSLCQSLNQFLRPGLINIHNLKIIRSGRFHHVDAHIVVPDFWSAFQVHTETHDFENKVVHAYPYDGEFAFHVDPCRQKFCSSCNLEDCPIRLEPFVALKTLTIQNIVKPAEYDLTK